MQGPIFLDIDGTLITSDFRVTERTRDALTQAERAGHRIILCSGRAVSGLKDVIAQLEIKPMMATLNGAYITDENRNIISESPFERETLLKMASIIKEEGLRYMYFFKEEWGTEAKDAVYEHELNAVKIKGTAEPIEKLSLQHKVHKLLSFGESSKGLAVLTKLKSLFPEYEIAPSSPTYVEINTPGVGKGMAVRKICSYLGCRAEDAICFGDYNNDISMFQTAGTGIAMGNAVPEIKALATEITASNDEDGIAIWIENNLLR